MKMFYEDLLVDEELVPSGFGNVPGGTSEFGCPTRISSNGRAVNNRLLPSIPDDVLLAPITKKKIDKISVH
jgi:hypothetical protein